MNPRRSVTVAWTATAEQALRKLPLKARKGLVEKGRQLRLCDDPRKLGKPLTDFLQGYYRVTYGRYRAIYTVTERQSRGGKSILLVQVRFVLAGPRKEGDKRDVYRIARKLAAMGLLQESEPG